jgi:gas vesicle protein
MHEQNSHNGFHAGHVLLALLGGALAGAGVAYLTAPATGEETRHRMRSMAHDTNLAVHRMPDAVRRASEAARDAFVDALELEEAPVTAAKARKAVTAKGGKSKRA